MIPRHLLPQIPSDKIEEFQEFLFDNGITSTFKRLPVEQLRPIQKHINRDKVEALKNNPIKLKNPLIVSGGGYVLDGHHRWVAEKELAERETIFCLYCRCTIKQLVEFGHLFDPSYTKTVYEGITRTRIS